MNRPSEMVEQVHSASKIYQLVSEFTVPIVVGILVDWQFGFQPWGTVIGTAIGFFLGGFRIRNILKQLERQDRAEQLRKDLK